MGSEVTGRLPERVVVVVARGVVVVVLVVVGPARGGGVTDQAAMASCPGLVVSATGLCWGPTA
jgi:hypothetical protein